MSTLTGFVLGSLLIIWPWQTPNETIINPDGTEDVLTYSRYIPEHFTSMDLAGIGCMVLGVLAIVLLEKFAQHSEA
jgi:putative membrane protein